MILTDQYKDNVYRVCFYMVGNKEVSLKLAKNIFKEVLSTVKGLAPANKLINHIYRITVKHVDKYLQKEKVPQERTEGSMFNRSLAGLSDESRILIILREVENFGIMKSRLCWVLVKSKLQHP